MKTTITIQPPQAVLNDTLAATLKLFAKDLREACAEDRELAAAAEAVAPSVGKDKAQRLLDAAVAGDKAAADELLSLGGFENYPRNFSESYHTRDGLRAAAAKRSAALLQRVADKLVPALAVAGDTIQKQYSDTLIALGELDGGLSLWAKKIADMSNGIARMPQDASRGVGAAYLVEGLGLEGFIK
jgi:hypothetical protein